jgi:uncharacterized protein (TIGR02996 family)
MPFSDEERALIEAIHSDPKSDTPRLAYADWCESHELAELAEFIRLMCREPYPVLEYGRKPKIAVATWEIKDEDPDRCARLIELLGKLHGSERFPETRLRDEYYRGLPVYECELSDGRGDQEHYLTLTPLARFDVWLYTSEVASWLALPFMRYMDALRFRPTSPPRNDEDEDDEPLYITEADMRAFIESPAIDRLAELNLCAYLTSEAKTLVDELEERVNLNFSH